MSWYDNVFLGSPDDDEPRYPNKDNYEPEEPTDYDDGDCEYWASQCYGRG